MLVGGQSVTGQNLELNQKVGVSALADGQQEIAKIIGTSQSYYAQYENGKRNIPFERIIILAKYYNVSLDYIAGFTDTPRKLI